MDAAGQHEEVAETRGCVFSGTGTVLERKAFASQDERCQI
jgi:hypothetical protein